MIHVLDFGTVVPTQRDLKGLQDLLHEALPSDPTPSLDDIARSPGVEHLGHPKPAPQAPHLVHPVRILVKGTDAAASAVLTRLMRADACWAEFAYLPLAASPLQRGWGLRDVDEDFLREAPAKPTPLIRDDAGVAVAGEATVTAWEGKELYGEIIVDSQRLCAGFEKDKHRTYGTYGARLVPMLDAPGLLAAPVVTAETPRRRLFSKVAPLLADDQGILTGRALQAGGAGLKVTVDGVTRKRPVDSAIFYRHLRDIQVVRP